MLIDTHAHLTEFGTGKDKLGYSEREIKAVIERARGAEIEKIIFPGTNMATSRQAIKLAEEYPDTIYAAVGIHPEDNQSDVQELAQLVLQNRRKIVAIGETGLDNHTRELSERIEKQKEIFQAQIEIARNSELPIIIHSRGTQKEILAILDKTQEMRVVFHCFSGDEQEAQELVSRGYYISICGNITWSKKLQKAVVSIPSERLMVETDSPFMTPLALKPAQNEPAHVRIIASTLAELRQETLPEVEQYTTANAREFFEI